MTGIIIIRYWYISNTFDINYLQYGSPLRSSLSQHFVHFWNDQLPFLYMNRFKQVFLSWLPIFTFHLFLRWEIIIITHWSIWTSFLILFVIVRFPLIYPLDLFMCLAFSLIWEFGTKLYVQSTWVYWSHSTVCAWGHFKIC